MNRVFRIIWNRALNQFVVASELCRSRAKGARSVGGSSLVPPGMGRLAVGVMLALAGTTSAFAHTTSIGYTNSGNDALSFYFGTYHAGSETTYTEGSLHLTSTAGFDQTVSFSILTGTKPTGLVDGDNNFYSYTGMTTLSGNPAVVGSGPILNWQGVTFSNLVHGTYTFTYVPIANPTQVWQPINTAILSNTITIINADLSTAPHVVTGQVVDQTYAIDPLIMDGGTVRNTADGTMDQAVSITNRNGTFDTNGHDLTLTGEMDGRGALIKQGDGTLNLRGANTSVGEIDLNGGAINVLSDGGLGDPSNDLKFNGGTLQWGAGFDLNSGRNVTLGASGGTFDLQSYNTNVANVISGAGSLTKTGTGTLTLSGANTYTGGTNVSQGDVIVASTGKLGTGILTVNAGSDVTMNNATQTVAGIAGGGDIALNGTALTVNGTGTNTSFGGVLSGTGGLTKTGTGTQALTGINTYTGGTAINGGTLQISQDANLGAAGPVSFNNGTLETTATMATSRDLVLNGNGTLNTDTGTTLTSNGNVSGAGALVKNGTGSLVENGVLSMSGGLTNNAGTTVLTNANSYTGGTRLNGGTVVAQTDANLGNAAGNLTFAGGTLETSGNFDTSRGVVMAGNGTIQSDDTTGLHGSISGTGTLTKTGTATTTIDGTVSGATGLGVSQGTLVVTGNNNYTGGTNVSGTGVLQIASDTNLGNASGAINASGGSIHTTADVTSGRTINTSGTGLTLTGDGHTTTLTGTIQGAGGVHADADNLVLSGTNFYTGGTTVDNGSLTISRDDNLGASSGSVALNSSTLHTTGNVDTSRAISVDGNSAVDNAAGTTMTAHGTVSGNGGLVKDGSGTLALTGSNTYTGGTTVNDGILAVSSDANLGNVSGGITLNGGTLETTATTSTGRAIDLEGGALAIDSGTTLTMTGTVGGNGGLVKNGSGDLLVNGVASQTGGVTVNSGLLTLAGENTYTGDTTVTHGVLVVSRDANLGAATNDIHLDGGMLATTSSFDTSRDLTVGSAGGTLDAFTGATLGVNGVVSGNGTLSVNGAGTVVLDGNNTYSGGTVVNAGTLQVGSDANLGSANGAVTIDNGGTLHTTGNIASTRGITAGLGGDAHVAVDANTTFVTSGGVNGGTGLVKNGAGTLAISGALSQSGGTTVNDGTLLLSGNNTYQGGTTLNGGTLQVSDDANLGDAANHVAFNGGELHATADLTTGRTLDTTNGANADLAVDGGKTFTVNGVVQGNGGLSASGAGTLVLGGTNTYAGNTSVDGGTLQIASDASLGGGSLALTDATLHATADIATNRAITVAGHSAVATDAGTTLSATGTVSGDTLVKNGAGTLVLEGSNTYTGGTVVNGGALQVGSDAALGNAAGGITLASGTLHTTGDIASTRNVTLDGGNFAIDNGTTFATSGNVAGTGGLVKNGAGTLEIDGSASHTGGTTINDGTLVLAGNNGYTGGTTLNGGTLQVGSDANLGNASSTLTFNGGLLHATGDVSGARAVTLNTNAAILTDAGATFGTSGTVSGSGGVVKEGNGTLVLTGNNTYTGSTTVDAGTLQIASDANLGASTAALTLNGGTLHTTGNVVSQRTLNLAGNAAVTTDAGTSLTSTGTVTGTGGLVKTGAGTLVLSGNNTFTGGAQLNGGTLSISSDANLGATANAVTLNGGNLAVTSSITTARDIVVASGGGSITTDTGATLSQTGSISGNGTLTKLGGGTLIVSGSNTFTGGTLVNGGTIRIDSGSSLGTGDIILQGGTLQTYATLGTGQKVLVSGDSGVNVTAGTTTVLSGDIDTNGSSGCFIKSGAGALSLTGRASLNQGTCVQNGTLRANGTLDSSFVTVDSIGTLRGIGRINGPVSVSGRLAPGNSPGTLTVDGTVTMNAGSTFEADIDGNGTGTGKGNYSRLLVVGAGHQFIAGGTLEPLLRGITGDASNTFTPVLGDTYRVVTAEGGIVGRFDSLTQPSDGLPTNTRFLAFYDLGGSNSIDLRVVPKAYSDFLGAGVSKNTLALAGALDRAVDAQVAGNGAAYTAVVNAIGALDTDRIADTVKAMAGEVHADQAAAARGMGLALNRDAFDHLSTDTTNPANKVWANVTQDGQRFVADNQGSGYNASTSHVTAGVDLISNESTVIGVGASHGESNVIATGGQGTIRSNAGLLYGQQKAGAILIDGVVSYGSDDWSTRRMDPFGNGSLNTRTDGRDTMASLTARLPLDTAGLRIEPYAGVIWQKVERDAVNETGTSPAALSLDRLSVTGTRGLVGVTAGSKANDPLAAELTWRVGVAAGVDSGKLLDPTVTASLAGQSFDTKAPDAGRGFVQFNANGTMRLAHNTYLYGGLTAEQGSGRTAYGVTAGVRVAF
ncbi:fibronectin-binding autotransporter adhesin [Luteibacter sp. HA06]